MFMEDLETRAISSAQPEFKPSIWKRYVDDILEKVDKDHVVQLTEHLNTMDTTGNIKFTYETESEGQMPFLDLLIVRNADGTVKTRVYRKKTHKDQYLNLNSHHPLLQTESCEGR